MLSYRVTFKSFVLMIAVATSALAACSGDLNPVRDAMVATGVGAQTQQAPEFVARSRPERLDYIPVGTSAPPRPVPAKTADQVKAVEGELDQIRARNEAQAEAARRAGATPPPAPVKPR